MARNRTQTLKAAGLVGMATGLRSQMGLASLVFFSPTGTLPRWLSGTKARSVLALAVGAEVVVDKLPQTPPRTQARGLGFRLGLGGLAGALAARCRHDSMVLGALTGLGAAAVGSFAGLSVRVAASKRVPSLVVALAEDSLAATMASAGARAALAS